MIYALAKDTGFPMYAGAKLSIQGPAGQGGTGTPPHPAPLSYILRDSSTVVLGDPYSRMDGSLEWQPQWQRHPRLGTAVSVTVSISGAAAGLIDVAPDHDEFHPRQADSRGTLSTYVEVFLC
jgi:hypothetical protein